MTSKMEAPIKAGDKVRRSQPWIYVLAMAISIVVTVILIFASQPVSAAPIFAIVAAIWFALGVSSETAKLNLEIVEKLRELETRLASLEIE